METIKIEEGQIRNLPWHQWRFEKSFFLHYLKPAPFKLADLIKIPLEFKKGTVKLRFLYNDKDCFCQYMPYVPKKVDTLQLVENNRIEYSLKYVNRRKIRNLLKQKKEADDILIVKNNRITDTSFSNIVLFDGEKWHTPLYPLLKGTARERLLAQEKIYEKDILVRDLPEYKSFKLINAMLDFESSPQIPLAHILF